MENKILTLTEYHIGSPFGISIVPHEEDYPVLHNHTYYEIQIHTQGCVRHLYNDCEEVINKGDLLLISPFLTHSIIGSDLPQKQFHYLNLAVSKPLFMSISSFLNMEKINKFIEQSNTFLKIHLTDLELKQVIKTYQQLENFPNHNSEEYLVALKFFLVSILEHFHKKINLSPDRLPDWLIDFLNELNNPELFHLNIKELSKLTFYTHNHLCYLFKKHMGVTLQHYFTKLKLNHAAFLLRTSKQRISYIAQQVGFDNQGHFAVLFKEHFFESPISYRKKNKVNQK